MTDEHELSRAKLRRLVLLPKWVASITETFRALPIVLRPVTDNPELVRMKDRRERLLPTLAKFKHETLDILAKERTLRLLPIFAKLNIDAELPMRPIDTTDITDPSLDIARTLIVLPKFTMLMMET
jgi:hypothetical protein